MPLVRKDVAKPPQPAPPSDDPRLKLVHGDETERWAAARDLSGQAEAVEALGGALETERDPRVREAILSSLARVGTSQSARSIVPALRHDDASLRTAALDALRVMPGALEGLVAELLADADPDVRLLACDLGRQLPSAAATRLLAELLAREAEANVCAAAIDVLLENGGPEALPAINSCAERFAGMPFIAFAARVAKDRLTAKPPP